MDTRRLGTRLPGLAAMGMMVILLVPLFLGTGAEASGSDEGTVVFVSTNAGELVRIDLVAATAALVGTAPGRGWTDIAVSPSGDLYAVSRFQAEEATTCFGGFSGTAGRCAHLYRIDPDTGEEIAHVGDIRAPFVSDIDFTRSGTLYANRFVNERVNGEGGLVTLNPATADFTLLPNVRFGMGLGAVDLENGGVAFHPVTGDVWGVESSFSAAESLFRIDPATGLAIPETRVRLGFNGGPTDFGFDGLEILPSGMFIATRGQGTQELFTISPAPSVSGFAEVSLIPITIDSGITGTWNGLTLAAMDVSIDIKPGSNPNSINLGARGVVPIAIFGSVFFDVATIDPATVTLAGATVRLTGRGGSHAPLQDVNGDGFMDLVVHVSTQAFELTSSDVVAVLEGNMFTGEVFVGVNLVRVVP